jgi:Sec-independent protein translocase protein TatA
MLLDPAKLLIIGVVALVVLGPDKLPAAAKKASSLLADLRRLQASVSQQVTETVGDHPLVTELTGVRDDLGRLRAAVDPRQALYRSIGLGHEVGSPTQAGGEATTAVSSAVPDGLVVPGSLALTDSVPVPVSPIAFDSPTVSDGMTLPEGLTADPSQN